MSLLHAAVRAENMPVAALDSSATACPEAFACAPTMRRASSWRGITFGRWGHRRIVHLTGPGRVGIRAFARRAFQACMRRAHLSAEENAIGYGQERIFPPLSRIRPQRHTAPHRRDLRQRHHRGAPGAVAARHGVAGVPDDVAVTGFGDLSISRYCDPPLTTIYQPFQLMGALRQVLISEPAGWKTPGYYLCRSN